MTARQFFVRWTKTLTVVLIVTSLALQIAAVPTLTQNRNLRSAGDTKFAVIVDAGSSGSRIYVYQYKDGADIPSLEAVKKEDGHSWDYKKRPGISALEDDLDAVEAYMQDLMNHLKSEVPESVFPRSAWSATPFMWFATAGMRLLPHSKANALTSKIREVANKKDVIPFEFKDQWARTLSGEEEGAFAWISLNYQRRVFRDAGIEDYGVVETGGASSQMTFRSNGDILSNKFPVVINRRIYPLYTHSFLYFGQDQIINRVYKSECLCVGGKSNCIRCVENGMLKNSGKVESACLLSGYSTNHLITVEGKDFNISLSGSGDPAQCTKEIDELFKADYECFTKPCSFAGIYQPPFSSDKKFYGISAIRYALNDLGIKAEAKWTDIKSAADEFCQKEFSSLVDSNDYAPIRCLTGIFIAKEFEHLQFDRDHTIHIAKFDTWTVGAVLYQLELMEILLPGDCKGENSRGASSPLQPSFFLVLTVFILTRYSELKI